MFVSPPAWFAFWVAAITPTATKAFIPENDKCVDAKSINVKEVEAAFIDGATTKNKCGSAAVSKGIFYTFEGNGNIMTATTCFDFTNFPSAIQISTGCDEACIADENPGFDIPCLTASGNGDTVTFDSIPGQKYYALVEGRNFNDDEGVFEFQVVDYEAPGNDMCNGAQKLIVTSVGEPEQFVTSDLKYATKDKRCNGVTGRGVWLTFQGTGNNMTVSTCYDTGNDFVHNFYIQTTCDPNVGGATQCLATTSSPLCQKQYGSTQTFESVKGQDYYVIVHGLTTDRVGEIKIAAWDYPPVKYDTCEDPVRLTVNDGVPYIGSTEYASPDSIQCGADTIQGLGTWHVFTGTGKTTIISTDYFETNFESDMLVVEECTNGGKCVAKINNAILPLPPTTNSFGSNYAFDAKKDQRYRVMVFGSASNGKGKYGITVKDYQPPVNDLCSNAVSLTANGVGVAGSTLFATVETLICPNTGATIEGRGVWYTFRGSGETMIISTCYAETDHPAEIYVTAGCGGACSSPKDEIVNELVCDSGFGRLVAVDTLSNQFYHVLVASSSNSKVGNHKISVINYSEPQNNECERAINLIPGGNVIEGNTAGATVEERCLQAIAQRGVWYIVPGAQNKLITVTTCAPQTEIDVNIEVRQSCTLNVCKADAVPSNGCDQSGLATSVTWQSFAGFSYYVLVSAPVSGTFGIWAYYTNSPTPPTPPVPPLPTPTPPRPFPPPCSGFNFFGLCLCFSDRMTVTALGKGSARMDQLEVGDWVLTKDGSYSKVYSFGHHNPQLKTEFLQIHTTHSKEDEAPLEITADHMLYIYNESTKKISLLPASQVKEGDLLMKAAISGISTHQVKLVHRVTRMGAYAPFTVTGDIVVNGIAASNYIALPASFQTHVSFDTQHLLQHAAYVPYRLFCGMSLLLGGDSCKANHEERAGLSVGVWMWLPFLKWLEEHHSQGIFLPLFLYAVAVPIQWIILLLEQGLLALTVPCMVVALVGYIVWKNQLKMKKTSMVIAGTQDNGTLMKD